MAEDELYKLSKWLGLTNQQMNILEALHRLQKRGEIASPKAIIDEDAEFRKVPKIQKSNFFAQLKSLQASGYVRKIGEASYTISFSTIEDSLNSAQEAASREAEELIHIREGAERYFRQVATDARKPAVDFVEYNEMYDRVADIVKRARVCLISRVFPRILYAHSPSLTYHSSARKYSHVFWERCIEEKTMEVTYLTTFDVDYLFQRLVTAYKDIDLAHDEAKLIINSIPKVLRENEKLKIYYLECSHCLDMIIPYRDDVNELFLVIRDEARRGMGSVYLQSQDLAMRFKQLFEEECQRALNMRDPRSKSVIKNLNEQLEKIYAKQKRKKR